MGFFKKIIQHELVSGSLYIFIGGMVANIFAFLLNLFLAHNLSYADYGIFASLLSLITLASIPSSSISTVIVKFATRFNSKEEFATLHAFYSKSLEFILIFSLGFFLIFALLSPLISSYLQLDNVFYIFLAGLTVMSFYLVALNTAFLQSLLKFGFISFVNSFGGLIKLITGVVLVYAGFRAFAGIWSILLMSLGTFLVAYLPLRKILNYKQVSKVSIPRNEIINYSVPTFLVILFLTSFTSSDVILVKHFFNATQGGFYAGLSLIGKVIFYFTAPIPMVMFPLLVKRHSLNQDYKKLFYLSLILVFLPAFSISIFYFMFPQFTINLFLGGRDYLIVAKYLGIFGLFLTIFSLVNVCVSFFLSINATKVVFFVIPAAVLQILFIYLFHSNFYQIIYTSIAVSFLLFLSLLIYYYKKFGF